MNNEADKLVKNELQKLKRKRPLYKFKLSYNDLFNRINDYLVQLNSAEFDLFWSRSFGSRKNSDTAFIKKEKARIY